MDDQNLTVRAEELGGELRRLREGAGLSLEAAGEMINASATKLSRMENGLRAGSLADVSALLAVYRCTGERRAELLKLAEEVDRRGWWQRNIPDFAARQRTLINLEAKADLIVYFEVVNAPGALQIGDYTRALMVESGWVSEAEAERRMVTRMKRHTVLDKPKPPQVLAILSELVVRHMVGGREVMRRQLEHLAEVAMQPHVSVRIVPNIAAHTLSGAFQLIRRSGGHKVVFLENLSSSLFLEDPEEIETHETAIRCLLTRALPEEESVQVIIERVRELGEPNGV